MITVGNNFVSYVCFFFFFMSYGTMKIFLSFACANRTCLIIDNSRVWKFLITHGLANSRCAKIENYLQKNFSYLARITKCVRMRYRRRCSRNRWPMQDGWNFRRNLSPRRVPVCVMCIGICGTLGNETRSKGLAFRARCCRRMMPVAWLIWSCYASLCGRKAGGVGGGRGGKRAKTRVS